jgi:hypothetical protein
MRQLTELQSQIQSFMDFLAQISTIIDQTVKRSKHVYATAEDTDGLMDQDIKDVRGLCGFLCFAVTLMINTFAGLA